MKTLEEIRALAAETNARQHLAPPKSEPGSMEDGQQLRQRCARLREVAAQRVAAAAQAGAYRVEVPVGTGQEYSHLEQLYGALGYRTAPAGGDHSSLVIIIKWN